MNTTRFGPATGCGSEFGGLSRDTCGHFCAGMIGDVRDRIRDGSVSVDRESPTFAQPIAAGQESLFDRDPQQRPMLPVCVISEINVPTLNDDVA